MDWLLLALSVGQAATLGGLGYLIWRLRSRGVVASWTQATTGFEGEHAHEYAHNPGDGRFYCACGESRKLGE